MLSDPNHAAPRRLASIAIAATLLLVASLFSTTEVAAAPGDEYDQAVVGLINDWRAELGLERLIASDSLSSKATSWSIYMASGSANCTSTGSRWGHSTLSLTDPANPVGTEQLAENIGYTCGSIGYEFAVSWSTAAGPLPAYCTNRMDYTSPEMMACGWLSNPTHRTTIERASHTHIGFGTATRTTPTGGIERFATHLFATAPASVPAFDPSCDGRLTIADALVIAQFESRIRSDAGSCALTQPATQINAAKGDVDGNGVTNIVDALRIARCLVQAGPCPNG